jgi:formamidase
MRYASLDMVTPLIERQQLSRDEAYSLSVAAYFAVTQLVDGTQGIHCRIASSLFRGTLG